MKFTNAPLTKLTCVLLSVSALTMILLACSKDQKPAQPTTQAPTPKGTVLVKKLPPATEGVELKDGALKVKLGYKFEPRPRGGFVIARMSGGQTVTSGGCGCSGGTCDPELSGGIIVCQDKGGCSGHCGLALTVAGIKTEIIQY